VKTSEQINETIARALDRYEPEPNSGCWLWTGPRHRDGYGYLCHARRDLGFPEGLVHRLSWLIHRGPIPAGLRVLHRCDTPPCMNPAHLFLGTQAENVADMVAKRRHRSSKPGVLNPRAKLTYELADAIRAGRRAGLDLAELAETYRVGISTIFRVVHGQNWVRA